jgi:hypothetical protein
LKSANDIPVLLTRKVISPDTVETRLKIGKSIVNIKSTFNGSKKYPDILFELASRKLSA